MSDDLSQPTPPAAFPSLAELAETLPSVAWLWPGWIPRGMITLLCAAPGAGKSYFALDLAHRLISGLPFPDGASASPPGANVIYVDAEGAPDLLNTRALAWNVDRSHLFLFLAEPGKELDLNDVACQERLLAMAIAVAPALIVVDSLGSASRGSENQVAAVGQLFGFLHRLARQANSGLLLIHHLRKRGPLARATIAGDDVRGSGHIVSLARSVLGLAIVQTGLDLDANGPRQLRLLKTNLGPYPAPLGVSFTPLPPDGVQLQYSLPAESLRPRTMVECCARWLLEELTDQARAVPPSVIEESAFEAGFSRSTLYRARYLLGDRIADTAGPHSPLNCWILPRFIKPPASPPPPKARRRQP